MKKDFTPKSRKDNIVVQELEGEVLIYDLEKNKALCLNKTSALVWQSCDGSRTIADISDIVGKQLNSQINEDLIWLALDQLSKQSLVEKQPVLNDKFDGLSRREVIKKVGMASLVALPMIATLTAPVAAQTGTCVQNAPACTPNGMNCTVNNDCCSCNCNAGMNCTT
jgi:hypothetical protein